ncbi:hypothetical protein FISHEDRAFT_73068 [Fistulina hepatica ATCC 64428]|uniref:Uncharacterized protein n=1 Tax=Fistulina hepatica ATCC 64428 TaxID=1128425 RepID=A0A0D7AE82_9AGAR|nr:hypothetical protein FISHEDRAFT_73068 [Fistulina hepatica ATCC 64428]
MSTILPFLTCSSMSSSSSASAFDIRSAAVQANLMPIKGFVHEVLNIITSVNRQDEANNVYSDSDRDSLATFHSCNGLISPSADNSLFASEPTGVNAAAPDLPSPLLGPRRAFLTSLIVTSKFTMDKCYSNRYRAWAKLAGIPAREIGRCECALTQALDWHFGVGHHSTLNVETSQVQQPVVHYSRMLVKSQSEPVLPLPAAVPFSTSWASAESIMTENAPEMIPGWRGM